MDRKELDNVLGEIFGDVAKSEVTIDQAKKIGHALVCKTISPDLTDEESMEILKRYRAFAKEIAGQEGDVQKGDDDTETVVFHVSKSLLETIVEDVKDAKISGTFQNNLDEAIKRFESSGSDEGSGDESGDEGSGDEGDGSGDEGDGDGDGDGTDEDVNKSEEELEDEAWGYKYDLNSEDDPDDDWGPITPKKDKKKDPKPAGDADAA